MSTIMEAAENHRISAATYLSVRAAVDSYATQMNIGSDGRMRAIRAATMSLGEGSGKNAAIKDGMRVVDQEAGPWMR